MSTNDFASTKAAFLVILLQQGITTQDQLVPMNGYLTNPPDGDEDKTRDLGADSLDNVEICMAVEDEWDILIEDGVAEKLLTVSDFLRHVCEAKGIDIPEGALA